MNEKVDKGGTIADAALDATQLESIEARAPLQRGATLGRYLVLEVIGIGGMGVVYAAYDPELDRKVAVKLLRGATGPTAGARLLREAQAMARLAHPNVIHVYDVGTIDDQVFVAMERIDGPTLRAWIADRRPPLDDRLALFMQAGRGLVAAHAAGLVHRDFKPDNVLVGSDGRVRVLDFGLARFASDGADGGADGASPIGPPLTRTGAFLGTPAYSAPEQLDGQPVSAATDQFAFCVALYEALYGERPFAGDTVDEIKASVQKGAVREPPSGSRVTVAVRRALVRGLAADPAARHPSMAALLQQLEPRPARSWPGVLGASLGLLAIAGVAIYASVGRRATLCGGASGRVAAEWNPTRRDQLHAAFAATNRPFAEAVWTAFAASVDRYTTAWVRQRTDACEATQLRGDQSTQAMDLRMSCYDQRLRELAALLRVYSTPDGETIGRAAEAAERLPPLDRCADVAALSATLAPPDDSATRARVEAVRSENAETVALLDAGRYKVGLERAQTSAATARTIGYAPLTARTLLTLGRAHYSLGQYTNATQQFWESLWAADAGRADEDKVAAWSWLAYTTGSTLLKPDEGLLYNSSGEAALARLGDHPQLESELRFNRCILLSSRKEYDEALRVCEQGLQLRARQVGTDSLLYAEMLQARGDVLNKLGRLPEALADQRRALTIYQQRLGPMHPKVAIALQYIALVQYTQGDLRGALAGFEAVLAMRLQLLDAEHPQLAITHNNVASTLWDLGRHADAVPHFDRALAIREKHFGKEHGKLFEPLVGIGQYHVEVGHAELALAPLERALAIGERDKLPAATLVEVRFALAQALWRTRGDRARARQLATNAQAASPPKLAPTITDWLANPR